MRLFHFQMRKDILSRPLPSSHHPLPSSHHPLTILSHPLPSSLILSHPLPSSPVLSHPLSSSLVLSHPLPSPPILSHPLPSSLILSRPLPSSPILSHPLPSSPVLSPEHGYPGIICLTVLCQFLLKNKLCGLFYQLFILFLYLCDEKQTYNKIRHNHEATILSITIDAVGLPDGLSTVKTTL